MHQASPVPTGLREWRAEISRFRRYVVEDPRTKKTVMLQFHDNWLIGKGIVAWHKRRDQWLWRNLFEVCAGETREVWPDLWIRCERPAEGRSFSITLLTGDGLSVSEEVGEG